MQREEAERFRLDLDRALDEIRKLRGLEQQVMGMRAEVGRLRAENQRLHDENVRLRLRVKHLEDEREEHRA